MKQASYFFFVLISSLVFISCRQNHSVLVAAERLMEERPDSALTLLCSIPDAGSLSGSDYALYALLMTQAKDKNDCDLSEDELIEHAVNYYRNTSDSLRAAKAYFYAGHVAQEAEYEEQAIACFQRSRDWMQGNLDKKYQFLFRHYLGMMYSKRWLREAQLAIYKEAMCYADNPVYLSLALQGMGMAFAGLNEEDSALTYQKHALAIAREGYPDLLPEMYYQLSATYDRMGKTESAFLYIDSALMLLPEDPAVYCDKGGLLYKMHRNDSVLPYLMKGVNSKNLYVQIDACRLVSDFYNSRTQLDSAYWYRNEQLRLRDTLDEQMRSVVATREENAYERNRLKEENFLLRERGLVAIKRYYAAGLMAVSLLMLLIAVYLFFYKKRQKQLLENQELLRQQEKTLLLMEELKQKESELRDAFYKRLNILTCSKLKTGKERLTAVDWQNIIENTNEIFNGFTDRLKDCYPRLTSSDIQLCCLLKMGIELKIIANIFAISKESVSRRKNYIRNHKMGYTKGTLLEDVLRAF